MKVSVCITTYQHAKYITQCLDSVLLQKTNFDYEILVGEDDSNDGTREICIEYAKKYSDKIRLFLNDRKNVIYIHGRPTGRWNFINLLKNAKGEYIALCEGDDYWTNSYKLQKQVDFLESHSDFAIVSHNVVVDYTDYGQTSIEWLGPRHQEIIDIEYLLRYGSGGATCSLMFRNGIWGDFPDWFFKMQGGDWAIQILCASHGKMFYFREPMGVYRRHKGGISAVKQNSQKEIDIFVAGGIKICDVLNKHFDYHYDKLLRKQLAEYFYWNLFLIYERNHDAIPARGYAWKILLELFPENALPQDRLQKLLGVLGYPFIENNHEIAYRNINEYIRNGSINWEGAYEFIKNIEKRQLSVGVEVGPVFSGLSEAFLKNTHLKKLYAFDPMRSHHSELEDLYSFSFNQLFEFGDRYIYLSKISPAVNDEITEAIDFVFFHIGDSCETLKDQLETWFPKIKQGGILSGQNYRNSSYPIVKKVVDDFFANLELKIETPAEGMWQVEKTHKE